MSKNTSFFFPSSPRCGSYDRAFDGLYLKRPFYYADGQHRYFTLYGTLQHYKFSATTVRTGNLRRIIAGHKKIWLFHDERDDGGVEVDRGRTNAKEGETADRVTYVEFVSMSLVVPPGLRESEPEYPRPLHLPSSFSPLLSFSLVRMYRGTPTQDRKLFLRAARRSANFSHGHPSSNLS